MTRSIAKYGIAYDFNIAIQCTSYCDQVELMLDLDLVVATVTGVLVLAHLKLAIQLSSLPTPGCTWPELLTLFNTP